MREILRGTLLKSKFEELMDLKTMISLIDRIKFRRVEVAQPIKERKSQRGAQKE